MTPLSGLNQSHRTASGGARAARRAHAEPEIRPDRSPVPDDSAAFAARSRRRGSAMGAYRTRTDLAAGHRRHVLSEGEPWDCLTISPS